MKTLSITLYFLYVIGSITAIAYSQRKTRPAGYEVAPMPPTQHVEYEEHEVAGFTLCYPDTMTSGPQVGKFKCITLPEGTLLMVPHWVKGASDDDRERWF